MIDPATRDLIRRQVPLLIARTAIGRATVVVLGMHLPHRITLRAALIDAGLYPSR